jgi:Ca2+/Na+ antiporter
MGVSQLVIGLTVVALGTSAPEVAAGIVAALLGIYVAYLLDRLSSTGAL